MQTVKARIEAVTTEFGDCGLDARCDVCRQFLTRGYPVWPGSANPGYQLTLKPTYHHVDGIWRVPKRTNQRGRRQSERNTQIRNLEDHANHLESSNPYTVLGDDVVVECPRCMTYNRLDHP